MSWPHRVFVPLSSVTIRSKLKLWLISRLVYINYDLYYSLCANHDPLVLYSAFVLIMLSIHLILIFHVGRPLIQTWARLYPKDQTVWWSLA
jgi:hypothetical protein